MLRRVVAGKLHGIFVTDANLNYHGSVTLDPDVCERAKIMPLEFVDIWNKSSGARIQTYVIYGERGSRCCILNGAAARTCQLGDEVIICNSVYVSSAKEICDIDPIVLVFDKNNNVTGEMKYDLSENDGKFEFCIKNNA